MYDSEHIGLRSGDEIRAALARLEEALARHESHLDAIGEDPDDAALQVLRRSVALMRQEAVRLRALIEASC